MACPTIQNAPSKAYERELRALWEAMAERGLGEGALVVADGEEVVYERGGMKVRQVPAWRWFLEGQGGRPGNLATTCGCSRGTESFPWEVRRCGGLVREALA